VTASWIGLAILFESDPRWMYCPYAVAVVGAPLVGLAALVTAKSRYDRRLARLALACSLVIPAFHVFVIAYFTFVSPLDFGPR